MADPPRREPTVELVDLGAAFRPQPMIHRHCANAPTALPRPAISQNGKGKAIRTAGNGHREKRAGLEAGEGSQSRCELTRGERLWW